MKKWIILIIIAVAAGFGLMSSYNGLVKAETEIDSVWANVESSYQRRADSVANYLVAKGVPAQNISAVGHGKANPVTGSTCDAVKGRKALIACLAPDRRVEIAVNGTK